jgi:prepilin-type N-terminal cleavage/methylation domain-containing protein
LCPKKGFTLVEVIVVLVILAILTAIAIPALTGYIDKAQDKQYISRARNISVAMKTVLNEVYASGEIDRGRYPYNAKELFTQGYVWGPGDNFVLFEIAMIGEYVDPFDSYMYFNRAAALIGEADDLNPVTGEDWRYSSCASAGSGATATTADGFVFEVYPEGYGPDKLIIFVTYKLGRVTVSESDAYYGFWGILENDGVYDPNAGYEVYKVIEN